MTLLNSPATGQILAFHNGPGKGVYGPARPLPVVLPSFTSSPAEVEGAWALDLGLWSPDGQVETTGELGYLDGDVFVQLADSATATATDDWIGLRIYGRVTAIFNSIVVVRLVDSGVTVIDTPAPGGWPANITVWTATEIRTGTTTPGKRRITVSSAPSHDGYEIRAYSGSNAATPEAGATHSIVVGTAYDTPGGIAVTDPATTAYNALYWRRTADGALRIASNTISFSILGLETTGFPANLPGAAVTFAEMTDAEPEGRVRAALSSTTSIPTGYQLWLAITTDSGVDLTSADAVYQLTAGGSVIVEGFDVGDTVTCAGFWKRTSDNAFAECMIRKAITLVGVTTDPPTPVRSWTANASLGTAALIQTKIASWAAGTDLPVGITAADEKIVELSASRTENIVLTNVDNSGKGRIWLRFKTTDFDDVTGNDVKLTGRIILTNCKNIGITRTHIRGGKIGGKWNSTEGYCVHVQSCADIWILRNWLDTAGLDHPDDYTGSEMGDQAISVNNSSGIKIHSNYCEFGNACFIRLTTPAAGAAHNTDCDIFGQVFGLAGHDDYKVNSGNNLQMRWNWNARHRIGDSNHEDWFQAQGPLEYLTGTGNVNLTSAGSDWWSFVKAGLIAERYQNTQGWFFGDGSEGSHSTVFRLGISAHNAMGHNQKVPRGDATSTVWHDCFLYKIAKKNSLRSDGVKYNTACFGDGMPDNWGGSGNLFVAWDQDPPDNDGDYSALAAYFVDPLPLVADLVGNSPLTPKPISSLTPKKRNTATKSFHWEDSNPLGISYVFRLWFDPDFRYAQETLTGETRVPGDVGAPVAYHWWRQFNYDGGVVTRYSNYTPGDARYDTDWNFAPL